MEYGKFCGCAKNQQPVKVESPKYSGLKQLWQ